MIALITFKAAAQDGKGAVSASIKTIDGNPVAAATVQIKKLKKTAITGENGSVVFNNLPSGTYTLNVSFVGYETFSNTIAINAGVTTVISLVLQIKSAQLKEVQVITQNKTQQLRESGFNVNAIDVRRYTNQTADLNQLLDRSAGVRIRQEGGLGSNFDFSINGLSSVNFFIDGIPLESYGGSLSLNNIPVNLVERMEVYKGVVPAFLGGDALGGAVNVITNQRIKKYLDASVSYGSFNTQRVALSGLYKPDSAGLVLRANAFYNFSNNNYLMRNNPDDGVDIKLIENGQYVRKNLKRFHDNFQCYTGQLEAGYANKKWADYLFAGILYSHQYKQLQTSKSLDDVIGQADTKSDFNMASLKYKKDNLLKGLSANAFASYGKDKTLLTDTSSNLYNSWSSVPTITNNTGGGELGGLKSLAHYTNTSLSGRINLAYEINAAQALNLNFNFSDDRRTSYDELNKNDFFNIFDKPGVLRNNIIGLDYQANLLQSKLTTNIFSKYYGFSSVSQQIAYDYTINDYHKYEVKGQKHFYGYGIASRYKVTDALLIKASYEHALQLPGPVELFGDGLFSLPNQTLKPEESDNINAGLAWLQHFNQHRLTAEASFFLRNATNFITNVAVGAGRQSQYINVAGVHIKGFEGEVRYSYKSFITAAVNASYQQAIDNKEYLTESGITVKNNTYRNRLPNRPWIYGNAEIGLGINNWLGKNTRLQFDWYSQYVHWFYLSWEAFGSPQSHIKIPSQLVHTASVSYSFKNGRYNVSGECNNLTNAFAYDNFRLQKPGRALYIKLRYFFN